MKENAQGIIIILSRGGEGLDPRFASASICRIVSLSLFHPSPNLPLRFSSPDIPELLFFRFCFNILAQKGSSIFTSLLHSHVHPPFGPFNFSFSLLSSLALSAILFYWEVEVNIGHAPCSFLCLAFQLKASQSVFTKMCFFLWFLEYIERLFLSIFLNFLSKLSRIHFNDMNVYLFVKRKKYFENWIDSKIDDRRLRRNFGEPGAKVRGAESFAKLLIERCGASQRIAYSGEVERIGIISGGRFLSWWMRIRPVAHLSRI